MKNITDFINEKKYSILKKHMKGGKKFLDTMTHDDKDPQRFCRDMINPKSGDFWSSTYTDPDKLYKDALDPTKEWTIIWSEGDQTLRFKCSTGKEVKFIEEEMPDEKVFGKWNLESILHH